MRLCHQCKKETTFFYDELPLWYLENRKSLCGLCYQKKSKVSKSVKNIENFILS